MNALQIIRFNFVILHPENKDNTNKSPKTGGRKKLHWKYPWKSIDNYI